MSVSSVMSYAEPPPSSTVHGRGSSSFVLAEPGRRSKAARWVGAVSPASNVASCCMIASACAKVASSSAASLRYQIAWSPNPLSRSSLGGSSNPFRQRITSSRDCAMFFRSRSAMTRSSAATVSLQRVLAPSCSMPMQSYTPRPGLFSCRANSSARPLPAASSG